MLIIAKYNHPPACRAAVVGVPTISMVTQPAEYFPWSEYLNDDLKKRGWSKELFAEKMGWPLGLIEHVLTGQYRMGIGIATKLSEILGTSVTLWLNLGKAENNAK